MAARQFEPLLGYLPMLMDTGRVSIHFKQRWNQYFEYRWRYRRGGVVVEVETWHFNHKFNKLKSATYNWAFRPC